MNPHALTDSSMTLPLTAPTAPGVPAWLSGQRPLLLAIGLVGACALLVLCLHG
jgi:hypothetical protein